MADTRIPLAQAPTWIRNFLPDGEIPGPMTHGTRIPVFYSGTRKRTAKLNPCDYGVRNKRIHTRLLGKLKTIYEEKNNKQN